jgi:UrcA family protein
MKTEMKTVYTTTLLAAIGTLALICAAPGAATAQDPMQLSRTVAYGDLNLDSQEGARVLYARLRNAANAVCRPLKDYGLRSVRWKKCYEGTLVRAVTDINKAALTKLYKQSVAAGKEKVG